MIVKDPRDIKELADAMQHFLDPTTLQSASVEARRTAAHYTLEANHAQMIDIMDEVSSRSGSTSGSSAGS